ncbi:hypothetical protein ACC697_38690, partial [Rhizobium ruizarguesonis]
AVTAAHLVCASPQIMVDAIGDKVESYSLRIFTEQRKLVEALDPLAVAEISPLISGFVRELGSIIADRPVLAETRLDQLPISLQNRSH